MLGLWLGLGRRGEDEAPPSSEEESSRPGEELKSTAIPGLEGGPVGFAQAASAGGACHFGRGAISGGGFEVGASAFEVGIMTQPLAFRAWRPWSGAFETHSADRPQWSSTVAACFAPAARTPEVLPGINAASAATAAIGVFGGAVALAL